MAGLSLALPFRLPPIGVGERSFSAARTWQLAALCAFAGWLLVVGPTHEVWGDESQAWLLAKESTLSQLLFERVRYEGTPGLWHTILWLIQRTGLPVSQLYLVSGGFAVAGAWVVLRHAPFPTWARLAILCSYFFSYQYSVIARSYSVDLLLVPLAATFFANRTDRPWRYALTLAGIANLNAHGLVAAAVLGCELLWSVHRERNFSPRTIGALAALALAGVFAVATVWQPADNGFMRNGVDHQYAGHLVRFVREAFLDRALIFSSVQNFGINEFVGSIATIFLLRPVAALFWSHPGLRVPVLAMLGGLLAFSTLVYSSPWHSGMLFLLTMFSVWILWPIADAARRRQIGIAFAVVAFAQAAQGVASGVWDMSHDYSPASKVAAEIAEFQFANPEAKIAAFAFRSFEVQPFLGRNPYANYNGGAPFPQYVDWKSGQPWRSDPTERQWARALAGRPDLIVASLTHFKGRTRWLEGAACRAGYHPTRIFRGTTIWRGAFYEDASIALFAPGAGTQCPRIRHWKA